MAKQAPPSSTPDETGSQPPSLIKRINRVLIGGPRDLFDRSIGHKMSLIPLLAWVGLGADGLSSSAYGPEEAFKNLGPYTFMAVGIALLTALTVIIISMAYSRIIEAFPHGGGGYVVASKTLGRRIGVVSGCALLVDYILTITVSIASAGDAIFSFLPGAWIAWKLPCEVLLIIALIFLNIRGVRESVTVLAPIFMLFLVTHIILIGWGIGGHIHHIPAVTAEISGGWHSAVNSIGLGAMFLIFIHAYSMGGGTYTGIEAVSNGLPIMREPRVHTAKRTMVYMASSLALTAGGLIFCYLLWNVSPVAGKTFNAILLDRMTAGVRFGNTFSVTTLITEGALLIVAAQAGFLDGPRVLANMAHDSWVPHRFGALSYRLTTQNGIVLMGIASLAALMYTHGDVAALVVMYSINVFLTFSLSIFGMLKTTIQRRRGKPGFVGMIATFTFGFLLCATILVITVIEKFSEGGWITLTVTALLVLACFYVKRHYLMVGRKLALLYDHIELPPKLQGPAPILVNPKGETAVILVARYGGLGIHTVQTVLKAFPGQFKNIVFISVGVVDSGQFKGEDSAEQLAAETQRMLERYVELAHRLNLPATFRSAIGTDVVQEAERLCRDVSKEFPNSTFFTGKIVFHEDTWLQRLLHNETALAIQSRLLFAGLTMVVLPTRV